MSNWHLFNVAVNVTFITSFPPVSPVICRGGERGALWFKCPSYQVLRPCSRQLSVILLKYIYFFLLSPTWAFCFTATAVLQREEDAGLFSLYAFCFCQHFLPALPQYKSLLQMAARRVLKSYLCLQSVSWHACLRDMCKNLKKKSKENIMHFFYHQAEILISLRLLWNSSASLISEESTMPLCL